MSTDSPSPSRSRRRRIKVEVVERSASGVTTTRTAEYLARRPARIVPAPLRPAADAPCRQRALPEVPGHG
jgi:hypothetical protein